MVLSYSENPGPGFLKLWEIQLLQKLRKKTFSIYLVLSVSMIIDLNKAIRLFPL